MINDLNIYTTTLGSYDHSTNTITLYYRAIMEYTDTYYIQEPLFLMALVNTMAHEYFHAISYGYCDKPSLWKAGATTEAFAEYYAYLYSRALREYKIANIRKDMWRKYYFTSLSLAKAYEFKLEHKGKNFGDITEIMGTNEEEFWDMFCKIVSFCGVKGMFGKGRIPTIAEQKKYDKIEATPQNSVKPDDSIRILKIRFARDRYRGLGYIETYDYICNDDDVQIGDELSVKTKNGCNKYTVMDIYTTDINNLAFPLNKMKVLV